MSLLLDLFIFDTSIVNLYLSAHVYENNFLVALDGRLQGKIKTVSFYILCISPFYFSVLWVPENQLVTTDLQRECESKNRKS